MQANSTVLDADEPSRPEGAASAMCRDQVMWKPRGRCITHDGFFARIIRVEFDDLAGNQPVLSLDVAGIGRRDGVPVAQVRATASSSRRSSVASSPVPSRSHTPLLSGNVLGAAVTSSSLHGMHARLPLTDTPLLEETEPATSPPTRPAEAARARLRARAVASKLSVPAASDAFLSPQERRDATRTERSSALHAGHASAGSPSSDPNRRNGSPSPDTLSGTPATHSVAASKPLCRPAAPAPPAFRNAGSSTDKLKALDGNSCTGVSGPRHALSARLRDDPVLGPWIYPSAISACSDVLAQTGPQAPCAGHAMMEFVDTVLTSHTATPADGHVTTRTAMDLRQDAGIVQRGVLVCGGPGMGKTSLLRLVTGALSREGGSLEGVEATRVWWIDGMLLVRSFALLGAVGPSGVADSNGGVGSPPDEGPTAAGAAFDLHTVKSVLTGFCQCVTVRDGLSCAPSMTSTCLNESGKSSTGERPSERRLDLLVIDDLDIVFRSSLARANGEVAPGMAGSRLVSMLAPLVGLGTWALIASAKAVEGVPAWARRKLGLETSPVLLRIPPQPARAAVISALFAHMSGQQREVPPVETCSAMAQASHGLSLSDLASVARFCLLSTSPAEALPRGGDEWMRLWRQAVRDRSRESACGDGGVTVGVGTEEDDQAMVQWAQIPGDLSVKARLHQLVVEPFQSPEKWQRLNVAPINGLVLHGASGSGKTYLARALARESGCATLYVEAPRLLRPYLGQSEAALREVFREARELAPAILILDQLDSVAAHRSLSGGQDGATSSVGSRVLSTLLNEMDGVSGKGGHIVVIGCVKDAAALDAALLRPGRFDHALLLPPPSRAVCQDLARFTLQHTPVSPSLNFSELDFIDFMPEGAGEQRQQMSAADVCGVARDAALLALRLDQPVDSSHMMQALETWKQRQTNLNLHTATLGPGSPSALAACARPGSTNGPADVDGRHDSALSGQAQDAGVSSGAQGACARVFGRVSDSCTAPEQQDSSLTLAGLSPTAMPATGDTATAGTESGACVGPDARAASAACARFSFGDGEPFKLEFKVLVGSPTPTMVSQGVSFSDGDAARSSGTVAGAEATQDTAETTQDTCNECANIAFGRVDRSDGLFYCSACWLAFDQDEGEPQDDEWAREDELRAGEEVEERVGIRLRRGAVFQNPRMLRGHRLRPTHSWR